MKTAILSVPSKRTEDVNWTSPLSKYLSSIYGKNSEYEQDVHIFNKLRQDIKGVNADITGIKLYFKYYSQLELLDLRVPFNRISGHKRVSFTWYDAFLPSVSHKQHSLPFEKANILFNLASIITKVAAYRYEELTKSDSSSSSSEDSGKEALQLLQQAAGIYEFISENFLLAPSEDLSQSSLKFLIKLLLAQSQEIFVLKAISGDLEQKKNSLISKLCASTANNYNNCVKMFNIDNEGGSSNVSTTDFEITDDYDDPQQDLEAITGADEYHPLKNDSKISVDLDPSWVSIINFKYNFYRSLSYYFHGLNSEANKKFGDAIANISKASEILNEIPSPILKQISKSGSSAYELLENYKYHKDAITIKLNELNKDNDLIYHDPVPSLVTLPEIKPLDSAKIIPMNKIPLFGEINEHNYENFLKNVVPIDIHEMLSYYSEEKSQFLRNELDVVDISNEELSSVLEYLKMPESINNINEIISANSNLDSSKSIEVDEATIGKVNEIANSFSTDNNHKQQIINLKKEIYTIINDLESKTQSASMIGFKDDIIKLKRSLYEVTNSDDRVFGLISVENNQLYNVLGKGSNSPEFKRLFELGGDSNGTNIKDEVSLLDIDDLVKFDETDQLKHAISNIEGILADLNKIKLTKQKLVEKLKMEIHGDDIADILILNSKTKTTNEIKNVPELRFPGFNGQALLPQAASLCRSGLG